MYGEGRSEDLVGEAIAGLPRDQLHLVSKVLPTNAGRARLRESFYASLDRLRTDYLDTYLLHWRGDTPLAETVEAMEDLVDEGVLRGWGVSNLDVGDMRDLLALPDGQNCQVNEVLYHVASRGIEYELAPMLRQADVATMAYCPLAQGATLREGAGLFENPTLIQIAEAHEATVPQVMLAWVIRDGHTLAIPRSGKAEHTRDNVAALHLDLTEQDLAQIDQAFPAPTGPTPLDSE